MNEHFQLQTNMNIFSNYFIFSLEQWALTFINVDSHPRNLFSRDEFIVFIICRAYAIPESKSDRLLLWFHLIAGSSVLNLIYFRFYVVNINKNPNQIGHTTIVVLLR